MQARTHDSKECRRKRFDHDSKECRRERFEPYQQQILPAADMKDKPAPPWQTRIASLSLEDLVRYRWTV